MGGSLTKIWWGIDRGSASGQNSVVLQEAVLWGVTNVGNFCRKENPCTIRNFGLQPLACCQQSVSARVMLSCGLASYRHAMLSPGCWRPSLLPSDSLWQTDICGDLGRKIPFRDCVINAGSRAPAVIAEHKWWMDPPLRQSGLYFLYATLFAPRYLP